LIAAVLFTSSSTINRWRRRFQKDRLAALQSAVRRSRRGSFWIALVIRWVTMQTPLDFGFLRSRWTCDTIVVLLREDHGLRVGREVVRRWLHQENLVWRRGPQTHSMRPRCGKSRRCCVICRLMRSPSFRTKLHQYQPENRRHVDAAGPTSRGRDAGNEHETLLGRRAEPANGWSDRDHRPPAQRRLVPGPPGRTATPAALLFTDSRDLRQRRLSSTGSLSQGP
jgi:transposase